MLMGQIKGLIRTPLCALRVVFQVLALEISAPCPAAGGATPHVQLMLVAGETVRVLNAQWVLVVERENQTCQMTCFPVFLSLF